MEEFRDLDKSYPHITGVLVNFSSPQIEFYERAFGDMAGGDPDNFRKTPVGVTPFIIIYTADENAVLKFAEYRATGKAENTPSIRKCMLLFDNYFR